jgi:DNA polymerase I-like protein with 3'-5' exonuclease and polymerase domains
MNTFTEAANAPIQGSSATMTKAAAGMIQEMIDSRGWKDKAFIVNLVHDEIVCEVHDSIAAEFAPLMRDLMEQAGAFYCPDVRIVAEFPEGSNGVVPYWTKEMAANEPV